MREDDSDQNASTHAEKTFILGLLKAAPGLELNLDSSSCCFDDLNDWHSYDGMVFMGELLRICDRLADHESGKSLLPQIFAYLEERAAELDSPASGSKGISSANIGAIDFLLFTFTDNPTGKDPTLKKLTPFMGPRIGVMCTQL